MLYMTQSETNSLRGNKGQAKRCILLTGGSAGIGLATAKMLMNKGYRVYSGSRRGGGEAQKSSVSGGEIIPIFLDINDENGLREAVQKIVTENGSLYGVICNAGNGIAGSIEDTTIEEARYQFETNFFGSMKTIQACLPQFRKQNFGKIIAITSIAAIIPVPYQAFYSAAKAAFQIFIETLSMEVKCYGIQCCTILPGDTKTEFTSCRVYSENCKNENSAYIQKMKTAVGKMEKDEQNGMKPEIIARAIVHQIEKKNMNLRVIPGLQYKAFNFLNRVVPNKLKINIINSVYS